jgi:endonuclease YncB( thermonuclease family)
MPRLIAFTLLLVTTTAANAQPVRVIDGDTVEVGDGERIRVWGIDAVEGDQICQRAGARGGAATMRPLRSEP